MVSRRASSVALLLFGSGACALIYQVVWLRELRLVFGASTAATSVVLGIFMGGLGLGGLLLGRRVDRVARPLFYYSKLELSIAGLAAATPLVIMAARAAYLAAGGLVTLGLVGATLLRLALSVLILGLPTFLMGGTLPAAVRSVETEHDLARRQTAVLYGANTLGAVIGAFIATFWMLEIFGTRNTLWLACGLNALIALAARSMSRSMPSLTVCSRVENTAGDVTATPHVPARFVYAAAATVGFAFLLMELVWYRMLGSILGGTTYTFGLILVVALLGIGIGGALYSVGRTTVRPSLGMFTVTCAVEALLIGLPLAIGDGIAVVAGLLQALSSLGFPLLVISWMLVGFVVILPAALVAGYQFPLLIGLLGAGRADVGRHVGTAYAWNTGGAIAGSIIGGFILLPLLTAPGCWRLVIGLLVVLAAAGLVVASRQGMRLSVITANSVVCVVALATIAAHGPTAVWRHSGIGARRSDLVGLDRRELTQWAQDARRTLDWEAEGLEVSVGLVAGNGLSFIINGKNDGNAVGDASTQVGSGLISAALHPDPRSALVVGLGTGSTAGWLGQIATIERVDVVELEPAILEVARRCAPVNADLFANKRVQVVTGDAREVLRTSPRHYDLIVSEPSNPYRAGIASLYTTEFYSSVSDRLRAGGIFTQWLQAYEVDTLTVRTIISTLGSVFPVVEIWQTNGADMVFLCSNANPGPVRVDRLRERLGAPPFREAFTAVWGVHDAEGFLAHFVAADQFARAVAIGEPRLNTDDRMLVEFGFARAVGRVMGFTIEDLRAAAVEVGLHRPDVVGGEVDWRAVEVGRVMMHALLHRGALTGHRQDHRAETVGRAYQMFFAGDLGKLRELWEVGDFKPRFPFDTAIISAALAEVGDPAAREVIDQLAMVWPLDAGVIRSRYLWRIGAHEAAAQRLQEVFVGLRTNPWIQSHFLELGLNHARDLAQDHPELAPQLLAALEPRFAVAVGNEQRLQTLLAIATVLGPQATVDVLHGLEPHVPWQPSLLAKRAELYDDLNDPRAERARRDLERFLEQSPEVFRGP